MGAINLHQYSILLYTSMFVLALGITVFAIPSVIFVAKKKKLLDKPDHRKKHVNVTPNLGGIAIFSAFAFVACIFSVGTYYSDWCYILAGSFLLFVTGLKDDLVSIDPYKKFLAQFIAAIVVVYLANIRLSNLHGFLGIYEMPYIISFLLSIVGITFVTNAFNLIDGVDGLAGSLSLILFLFLGIAFAWNSHIGLAMISFTLAGTVLGFLKFNFAPARIFMGDTGSLLLGFLASVLCIAFVNKLSTTALFGIIDSTPSSNTLIVIALAAIIVPVYDTFRVFTTRILRGFSPFKPDRTHIHHVLLDTGFNAPQVVLILSSVTLFFIALTCTLSYLKLGLTLSIIIVFLLATALVYLSIKMRNKKLALQKKLRLQQEQDSTKNPDEYFTKILQSSPETVYEDKVFFVKEP